MKLNFYKLMLAAALMLLLFSRLSHGGDFAHLHTTDTHIFYSYTGTVYTGDSEKLERLVAESDLEVVVIIDSPGGAAYEGIELYWAAKRLEIRTIAGTKFGAYSAAALFWMGGSGDLIEGSLAGFHLAYCNPYNPPGCYVADIDSKMMKCFYDKFGRARSHEMFGLMLQALDKFGVNGFVMFKMTSGKLVVAVEDPTTYVDSFPTVPPASLKPEEICD